MTGYFSFYGRATRSEYWAVLLINLVAVMALLFAGALTGSAGALGHSTVLVVMGMLVMLAAVVASIFLSCATIVRRLRDAGLNPWWVLAAWIPYVGAVATIVFGCLGSKPEGDQ